MAGRNPLPLCSSLTHPIQPFADGSVHLCMDMQPLDPFHRTVDWGGHLWVGRMPWRHLRTRLADTPHAYPSLGFFPVLYGIMSWTVDSYQEYSASALGAAVFIRNIVGAAFPLIGRPMYNNLGRHWASSLIAFLGVPLIPCVTTACCRCHALTDALPLQHLLVLLLQRKHHSQKQPLGSVPLPRRQGRDALSLPATCRHTSIVAVIEYTRQTQRSWSVKHRIGNALGVDAEDGLCLW